MAATVPSTERTTNMSPTCHACGQRLGQIKDPLLYVFPPANNNPTIERKKKKNKKNKLQDGADTTEVIKTEGSGVLATLGNLLTYAQDWIPGYHFAKRVVDNLYRSTSLTTSLTIFSVYPVASSDPIVSIPIKRKRPKHKKKGSYIREQPPKPKLPLPASPSKHTCRRCHQVCKSRNQLFRHLDACRSSSKSTSAE